MRKDAIAAALCSLIASVAVHAQQAPQVVKGKVRAVVGNVVTVQTPAGDFKVALAPDWSMSVSAPITLDKIKPGSFIGTTNIDVPGGGRSSEVHVFPPESKALAGQRTLDAKSGSKMTNGRVGKVVASANGRQLDISFPGGTRHVIVPPSALITSVTPAPRTMLKPGISVAITVFRNPGKPPLGRFVSTGPNGAPPAR